MSRFEVYFSRTQKLHFLQLSYHNREIIVEQTPPSFFQKTYNFVNFPVTCSQFCKRSRTPYTHVILAVAQVINLYTCFLNTNLLGYNGYWKKTEKVIKGYEHMSMTTQEIHLIEQMDDIYRIVCICCTFQYTFIMADFLIC